MKRSTLHAPDTFTQIKRGGSFILFPFFFEQFYFTPIFLDFTCKRARGDFVQGGAGVESKLSHIHTPIYFSKIITEGNKNNIRRSSKESKEIQHRQVTDTIWFEICFYPPSLVFLSIAALDWSFSIPSISHHLHLYLDLFFFIWPVIPAVQRQKTKVLDSGPAYFFSFSFLLLDRNSNLLNWLFFPFCAKFDFCHV